jgi:hypothetical protein
LIPKSAAIRLIIVLLVKLPLLGEDRIGYLIPRLRNGPLASLSLKRFQIEKQTVASEGGDVESRDMLKLPSRQLVEFLLTP